MAEVSKIRINDVEYELKDAELRERIKALIGDIDEIEEEGE